MSSPFPPDEQGQPEGSPQPTPDQPPTVQPNEPQKNQPPVYAPGPVATPPIGKVPPGAYPPGAYPPGYPPPGYYPGYKLEQFLEPDEPPRGNIGLVVLSWLAVLAVTGFILVSVFLMQIQGVPASGEASSAELMQVNLQGKMLVGQQSLMPGQNAIEQEAFGGDPILTQIETLNMGPPENRYACALLLNEFESPDAALDQMDYVDELIESLEYEETENQIKLNEIVRLLLEQYDDGDFDVSTVPVEDQEFLKEKLGFIGELALLPKKGKDSAGRTALEKQATVSMMILVGAVILFGCTLLGGAVLAFTFFVMTASGKIQPTFLSRSTRGRIYIETFAIWLCGFTGLQIAMSLLDGVVDSRTMFFLTPVIFFGSLLVLIWPVARGITFSQMRTDIGWKMKNPLIETAFGAISYMATVPFMAISLVFVFLIMLGMSAIPSDVVTNELSSGGAAGHPIQEQIAMGDPWIFLGVFITACIAAPIVEETMFRGVLYRHLRDSTWRWSRFASVLLSALVSSLIFASIHPQGLMGIPVLTTLAFSFSLVREWRDSLIAPMVMHALNNGMVTCLLFLIL